MSWPIPWVDINEFGARAAKMFESKLQGMLDPQHSLQGVPVSTLARRYGTDDVLYRLQDGSGRIALVHLTTAKPIEGEPQPACRFFADLDAWKVDWTSSDPQLR